MLPYQEEQKNIERRRFPRMPLQIGVHCKCLLEGKVIPEFDGLSEDLGAGGLRLHCMRRLEPGQLLVIPLRLPIEDKSIFGSGAKEDYLHVIAIARVAWCVPIDENFKAGMEFYDLDTFSRQRLKAFLISRNLPWGRSSLIH